MSLDDYMAEFAFGDFAAVARAPVQSGLMKRSVGELQNILIKLGWKEANIPRPNARDFGMYGPKTASAWAQSSRTRRLNPTFERASATEAYVHPATFAALNGASVPSPMAPAPAAPAQAASQASAGEEVTFGATDAADILYALGWTTKKLPRSQTYTPALSKAWAVSATSRGLNPRLRAAEYLSSVYVDGNTLTAMQAEARQKKVAPRAPRVSAAARVTPGTVVAEVLALQDLLYGVGWTAAKLKRDGKYGEQTKRAWHISAKGRNLPQTFERVSPTSARVAQATYEKIQADAAKTGATPGAAIVAPTASAAVPAASVAANVPATDTTDKPVADVQRLLIKLGWKASTVPRPGSKDFGVFSAKTQGAWENSTKTRGLDSMFVRVNAKTARINTRSYVALLEGTPQGRAAVAAQTTPATTSRTSTPATPREKIENDAYVRLSNVSVPVLDVQRALLVFKSATPQAGIREVPLTGVWDAQTLSAFQAANILVPAALAIFLRVVPNVVSPDNRLLKVQPNIADLIQKLSARWQEMQPRASTPTMQLPTSGPVMTPVSSPNQQAAASEESRAYASSGGGGGSNGGGAVYDPAPSEQGVPGGGSPASGGDAPGGGGQATDQGPQSPGTTSPAETWDKLLAVLTSISTDGPKYVKAFEAAQASGATIRPEAEEAFNAWVNAAERVKQTTARVIEGNPQLVSILNAASAPPSLQGLEAYLGELSAVADEIVSFLKTPLNAPEGASAAAPAAPAPAAVEGLGQLVKILVGLAAALGSAIWPRLIQLLGLPIVRTAVVAGSTVGGVVGVADAAINGETQAYADVNDRLNQMVADGTLTAEQAEKLKEKQPGTPVGYIIAGLVGLGGIALYLRSRSEHSKKGT